MHCVMEIMFNSVVAHDTEEITNTYYRSNAVNGWTDGAVIIGFFRYM